MNDEPTPRQVFVGLLPTAGALYVGGEDPVAAMIVAAGAELDRQRAVEERARLAAIADIERAKNMRRARAARRFKQALKVFARLK